MIRDTFFSLHCFVNVCRKEKMCIRDSYTSLKETTYQADGLRAMLLQRNRVAVNEAVSYTHLDVYKRQCRHLTGIGNHQCIATGYRAGR